MLLGGFLSMNPGIQQLFPFLENSPSTAPFIIAGPCSVETPEQLESTVSQLAGNGISLIRAGVWKPRTRPNGFEGLGSLALPWLQETKKKNKVINFVINLAWIGIFLLPWIWRRIRGKSSGDGRSAKYNEPISWVAR